MVSNIVYIEYAFRILPLQPASEILIAELGELGFESFVETQEGVLAYLQKENWKEDILDSIFILRSPDFKISYQSKEIEQENWNATWEKNFSPIHVGNWCTVRAPFHEKPNSKFDIVIEPKMSFGTGHHETTYMMLHHILDHDFEGKSVLDMGTGTGVLAILGEMKGAIDVDAIDMDHWCYVNALENVERNDCHHIQVLEGDSSTIPSGKKYDVILANINRNILLKDISAYANCLKPDGSLFLSGFYYEDIIVISAKCTDVGLKFEKNIEKNNWVAVKYVF
ncbi:50S ribosomal protein L11 methyltransferase [Ulvibacterium sp.]|uniref:50S ribosomal protein L11 methyltransferase n=1 Tax=Ulvibacterium sp. TaxID=2665914 RepID=UPI0026350D94|nr:50S ribosomal protein L11 methyltransferase [Ulvibacterium sp.]